MVWHALAYHTEHAGSSECQLDAPCDSAERLAYHTEHAGSSETRLSHTAVRLLHDGGFVLARVALKKSDSVTGVS
jgi:hypothetical protein